MRCVIRSISKREKKQTGNECRVQLYEWLKRDEGEGEEMKAIETGELSSRRTVLMNCKSIGTPENYC